jgi:hypothetical protein
MAHTASSKAARHMDTPPMTPTAFFFFQSCSFREIPGTQASGASKPPKEFQVPYPIKKDKRVRLWVMCCWGFVRCAISCSRGMWVP